jgi:hypothetical protein
MTIGALAERATEPYRVTLESTVADGLYAVPDAEQVFEFHGCLPTIECTEEHHARYVLSDLDLVCHIDGAVALVADLDAELEAVGVARSAEAV